MPEGRTRRRPFSGSSFLAKSRRWFLTSLLVFKDSFCSFVASKLRMIWGDFWKILARERRDLFDLAIVLAIMRLVRIPSPVGSFGRMI